MATTVRTTPAASGDVTFMTQRKRFVKENMRVSFLPSKTTRYRRGVVRAVIDQNRIVVAMDGEQHMCTRVLGKNRFVEELPS